MSGLIESLQNRDGAAPSNARVLAMTDTESDDVLSALSSEMGRAALRALYREPRTPSELADSVDTSLQNVHYHVSNLLEAGLVEPVDSVYSEKGNEMTVYGAASDPLVFVSDADAVSKVERSISKSAGSFAGLGLAGLGVVSLLVQWGAETAIDTGSSGIAQPAGTGSQPFFAPGTLQWLVFEVLEPGLVFFVVALAILAIANWWFNAGRVPSSDAPSS